MRKLFISQPMRGKNDEEIRAECEKAISLAKSYTGDEVEVIGSFFDDFNGTPLEFLAKSIALLATADIVYFAEGWECARGCRIEHECAVAYDAGYAHCIASHAVSHYAASLSFRNRL